jgi:hypothetical protein
MRASGFCFTGIAFAKRQRFPKSISQSVNGKESQ